MEPIGLSVCSHRIRASDELSYRNQLIPRLLFREIKQRVREGAMKTIQKGDRETFSYIFSDFYIAREVVTIGLKYVLVIALPGSSNLFVVSFLDNNVIIVCATR